MGGRGFVFAGQRTLSLILFQHQQQTHLELALRRDAVQTVLVKAETLAGVQLVVPALVADDGLAFQRGQDSVAGGTVRGQACLLYTSRCV